VKSFWSAWCSCINVVNASSVKPGVFGNAPSPLLKMMYNESTPSFWRFSANSLGRVKVYCVEPARLCSLIILCSTILGMLISFISVINWDNIGR